MGKTAARRTARAGYFQLCRSHRRCQWTVSFAEVQGARAARQQQPCGQDLPRFVAKRAVRECWCRHQARTQQPIPEATMAKRVTGSCQRSCLMAGSHDHPRHLPSVRASLSAHYLRHRTRHQQPLLQPQQRPTQQLLKAHRTQSILQRRVSFQRLGRLSLLQGVGLWQCRHCGEARFGDHFD